MRRTRRALLRAWTILVVAAGALVLSGCGSGQPGSAGPAAARLVPADALAYLDVALDSRRPLVEQALTSARRLGAVTGLRIRLEARLSAICGVSFSRQIAPWLGHQAAVAFLPSGAGASELIVLAIAHPGRARSFLALQHAPAARIIDGQMVIGTPSGVAAALAAARHPATALAHRADFRSLLTGLPGGRVIDAYATATGVTDLLGGRSGAAGVLAAALGGHPVVAAGLIPRPHGLAVAFDLADPRPAPAPFSATLLDRLPATTGWAIDMASLRESAPELLSTLAAGTPGGPAGGLLRRLGAALRAQGVAPGPLVDLFGEQGAIFGLDGGIGLIARTSEPQRARMVLGPAGAALVGLLAPTPGVSAEPVVATVDIDGTPVTRWQQGSAQLDIAVHGRDIILTTSGSAMAAVIADRSPLSRSPAFASVLAGRTRSVGSVLFGAIRGLVRGGDPTGLLTSLGLSGSMSTLSRISAAGLASTGGHSTHTRAEFIFTIS